MALQPIIRIRHVPCKFVHPRPLRRLEAERLERERFLREYPQAVRPRDVLRVHGEGDYVVCRFIADELPYYLCTNGVRTRKIIRLCVVHGMVDHYRDGKKIPHRR